MLLGRLGSKPRACRIPTGMASSISTAAGSGWSLAR